MSRSSSGDEANGAITNGTPSREPRLSGRWPAGAGDCGVNAVGGKRFELGCSAFTHCTLAGTDGADATGVEFQSPNETTLLFVEELNSEAPGVRGLSSVLFAVIAELFNVLLAALCEKPSDIGRGCSIARASGGRSAGLLITTFPSSRGWTALGCGREIAMTPDSLICGRFGTR